MTEDSTDGEARPRKFRSRDKGKAGELLQDFIDSEPFNEGYLASSGEHAIREDLTAEAIRLGVNRAEVVVPMQLEEISHGVLAEPLQQQHLHLELAVPENFQPS